MLWGILLTESLVELCYSIFCPFAFSMSFLLFFVDKMFCFLHYHGSCTYTVLILVDHIFVLLLKCFPCSSIYCLLKDASSWVSEQRAYILRPILHSSGLWIRNTFLNMVCTDDVMCANSSLMFVLKANIGANAVAFSAFNKKSANAW